MFLNESSEELDIVSPALAEIAGIHAGDGYLRYQCHRKELDLSGALEEQGYYDSHIIPLFEKEFRISIKAKHFVSRNTYGFVCRNFTVINTLRKLGFPSGSKSTIVQVPKQIQNSQNKKVIASFLRGYFDTDGCLNFRRQTSNKSYYKITYHYYPRLLFSTCSKALAEKIVELLEKFDIRCKLYVASSRILTENTQYRLQALGTSNLKKWVKHIGFGNETKSSRYLIWKKFGFCPPNTTFKERVKILSGQLDIQSFYDKTL
ncbi:hypothetical protein BVX95_01295 [archaeon D22]|nr:hypothetical protein BVX95_01295 [archaeon D22]